MGIAIARIVGSGADLKIKPNAKLTGQRRPEKGTDMTDNAKPAFAGTSEAPCSIPEDIKTVLEWFVNNWTCDWHDDIYTEDFCGNETDCRRCMAKHLLESNKALCKTGD